METLPAQQRCTKYFREMSGSWVNRIGEAGKSSMVMMMREPRNCPVDEFIVRGDNGTRDQWDEEMTAWADDRAW